MMRSARAIIRFLAVLMVFTVAAYPCWRLELLCQREAYHALESTGVLSAGPTYSGQIMGRNIPHHPAWIGVGVTMFGAVGVLPALAAALLLTPRFAAAWRRHPHTARWRWLLRSGALAWLLYAATMALIGPFLSDAIRNASFWVAKHLGCGYFEAGRIGVGPDGPFITGSWVGLCNFLWRSGPRIGVTAVAGAPALLVLMWSAHRRLSVAATCCGACGYDLIGLKGATCPECGTPIESHKPSPADNGRSDCPI